MICLSKNKRDTAILLDYCAGTLDSERAGALENHARECAQCRALIDAQMNVWRALGELPVPEVSPDFDARLYARIARHQGAEPAWHAWVRSLRLVLAGVAAVAIVAVVLMQHVPRPPDSSQQIRPESVDIEQVEVTLQDLDMLTPPAASAGKL